jgi:hypothetical protein
VTCERAAARCLHDLAREIEALNARVSELEHELTDLLTAPGDPLGRPAPAIQCR